MDPNAAYTRIKHLQSFPQLDEYDTEELGELIEALNEWISKGGFLPTDWSK